MLDELSQLPQPEIGKLVYKLRQQLNLTQQELSQQLCVSFATVNRWEREKNKPRHGFKANRQPASSFRRSRNQPATPGR